MVCGNCGSPYEYSISEEHEHVPLCFKCYRKWLNKGKPPIEQIDEEVSV